jgi:hypothetical protein
LRRWPERLSGLTQPLYECVPVGRRRRRSIGWSCDSKVPDPVAHRLLRACGERPGRRAADNGDEFASFHYLPVPPNAYVRKDSTPTWQESAALRDFDPVYVSLGSLASKAAEADRPCTSAAPPKADVNSPPWLPPLSAISRREQVQQILAKDSRSLLRSKKKAAN